MTAYYYAWGNNKDPIGKWRMQFKGRKCRVLHRGNMNSCLVEFCDNGNRLCCSRNALRKFKEN